MFWKLAYSSVS